MCKCNKNKTLDAVRKLAIIFSNGSQQDVKIYNDINGYKFEPINTERQNIV